jgi:hypothetical protein
MPSPPWFNGFIPVSKSNIRRWGLHQLQSQGETVTGVIFHSGQLTIWGWRQIEIHIRRLDVIGIELFSLSLKFSCLK